MKLRSLSIGAGALFILSIASCKKNDNTTTDFETLKQQALTDFTNKVALPQYKDLDEASMNLKTAIESLNTNTTEENLNNARTAWKNMRTTWEQCEGFLFGPIEDNDFDPNMDTWPTDFNELDSLLASSNNLEVNDVQAIALNMRGFHPIEYIIFGDHGNRTAAALTARQKKYMVSLTTDLNNTCHALYTSWTQQPLNFMQEILTAGSGSTKYEKKQEVFLAMVGAMSDICGEVGEGKIKEPYDAYLTNGAQLVESPYSGNSMLDFKNNIIGLQNVYIGKYKEDGAGLNELVAAKNKSLDNKIQSQIADAISAFDKVTVPFEQAITMQRLQVQQVMNKLAILQETLDTELKDFVKQNITD